VRVDAEDVRDERWYPLIVLSNASFRDGLDTGFARTIDKIEGFD